MKKNDHSQDYAEQMNQYVQDRIVRLRSQAAISAREMSLSLGQSENYINKIENRKSLPSITMFHYICEFFRVTPQEFYTEEIYNPILMHEINLILKDLNDGQLSAVLELLRQFFHRHESPLMK